MIMPTSVASKSAAHAPATDVVPLHPKKSFQDLIFALQRFWAEQGCVILPVSYTHLTLPTNREV